MKTVRFGGIAAAILCVTLFVAGAARGQQDYPVSARTLKNGMKVLVQTDHSIPNVALYIFYRIGSRNEGPERRRLCRRSSIAAYARNRLVR